MYAGFISIPRTRVASSVTVVMTERITESGRSPMKSWGALCVIERDTRLGHGGLPKGLQIMKITNQTHHYKLTKKSIVHVYSKSQ